jgi:hypothetical protein
MSVYPQVTSQSMLIDGATSVVVNDITQDPADGAWVRRIVIYTDGLDANNPTPTLTLVLRGATKDAVEVQTPRLEF